MNIYEKIQNVKLTLNKAQLKKTGKNTFSNYEYYELKDFIPTLINSCNENKLMTMFSFDNELASLTVVNSEKPEETITITSPMKPANIKGASEIQNLGGVETYQRRYLYMAMFDIVENDMVDAPKIIKCDSCGIEVDREVATYSYKNFNKKVLCKECQKECQKKDTNKK